MEYIKTQVEGAIEIITIDQPKTLNALNSDVLKELDQAIDAIDLDTVRALIITGGGERAFVAGADIAEMKDLDEEGARQYGELGHGVMRKIETLPIAVIAAVNGFALGGGDELALSCDIRIASDNATFGQPEVGLGITPGFGGTQRLARKIGSLSKASEILLTARNIDAEEALRIGLVSKVVPQAELMDEAMKMARYIARNAPIAVAETKRLIREGLDGTLEEGLEKEVAGFAHCFTTEDQTEGMTAFVEKRKEKNFQNK